MATAIRGEKGPTFPGHPTPSPSEGAAGGAAGGGAVDHGAAGGDSNWQDNLPDSDDEEWQEMVRYVIVILTIFTMRTQKKYDLPF